MKTVGIIGLGYWGEKYIRITNELQSIKFKGICDINIDILEKFKKIVADDVKIYNKAEDLIEDPEIHYIIIVTIASTHYNLIKTGILNNKEILVEKPYTTNLKQAIEITDLLNKKNKNILIGHTYLFNNKISWIKTHLENNFQKVDTITFEWYNSGPIRNDTNEIYDLAVHCISILFYIYGTECYQTINAIRNDNGTTFIIIKLKNNIIVNINVSWNTPGKTRKITFSNSYNKLVYDDVDNTHPIKIYFKNSPIHNDNMGYLYNDGHVLMPHIGNIEPLKYQFYCWINNHYIDSNQDFGIKVMKILNEINLKISN
jgi:predicted dehydrogenase